MKNPFILVIALFTSISGISQSEFKVDSLHYETWVVSNSEWDIITRDLYAYDNGGQKETNILRLDKVAGTMWVNDYQFNKTYDANNNLETEVQQNWNSSMTSWENLSRHVYTNSTNDQVLVDRFEGYSANDWNVLNEHHHDYDIDGNMIEDIYKTFDYITSSLVNSTRETFIINDQRLVQTIHQSWRAFTGLWENAFRWDYIFDANNFKIRDERIGWTSSNNWGTQPTTQYLYTNYADGSVAEVTKQLFGTSGWQNTDRFTYTYDASGNIEYQTHLDWDTLNNEWFYAGRNWFIYNSDGNLAEHVSQTYDETTSSWKHTFHILYYWSPEETLKVEDHSGPTIKLFPNPFTTHINLETLLPIDGLSLYDLQGKQLLMSNTIETMDMETLASGTYFLKIASNGQQHTKKIIKN